MEYLDGHTLRNELDTHGFLPLDRALDVAKAVLDALDFAHKGGVVHRDVKPENVQLLSDGRIKITDFGIARLTFEPNLTMDGQVFGTPSYMSPEQVVGREIDARSDLFSLGVVMYEMISGRKPFQGDSVVSITYAIMNAEPSQPQQANFAVWQVLQRAMDKSPALRYSSATEMKGAVEAAEQASTGQVLDPMTASYPFAGTTPAVPPGAYNPYGGALPPFQVGNAPPVGNPYVGTPYPPAPAAPPSYPFNPYQAPPPGMGAPMGSPGYPPVPVYYPPPPRPPLITPEMKGAMARGFLAFLAIGTLLLLAVFAVSYFSKAYSKLQTERANPSVSREMRGGIASNPPARNVPSARPPEVSTPGAGVAVDSALPPESTPIESPPGSGPPASSPATGYDLERAAQLVNEAMAVQQENPPLARAKLYEARRLTPPDTEQFAAIEAMIQAMSG